MFSKIFFRTLFVVDNNDGTNPTIFIKIMIFSYKNHAHVKNGKRDLGAKSMEIGETFLLRFIYIYIRVHVFGVFFMLLESMLETQKIMIEE